MGGRDAADDAVNDQRDDPLSRADALKEAVWTAGWIHAPNRVSLVQSVTMVPKL